MWCKQKGFAADSEKTFFECIRDQFPEKCDITSQHRIRKNNSLYRKGKATRIIKGLVLKDIGLQLCRIEGDVTGVTGSLLYTNYSVQTLESNILSETRDTCDTPPCVKKCKNQTCLKTSNIISPTDLYGDLCGIEQVPTPIKRIQKKRTGCHVLWDGSEQSQTNDSGISALRYLFTGSMVKGEAV